MQSLEYIHHSTEEFRPQGVAFIQKLLLTSLTASSSCSSSNTSMHNCRDYISDNNNSGDKRESLSILSLLSHQRDDSIVIKAITQELWEQYRIGTIDECSSNNGSNTIDGSEQCTSDSSVSLDLISEKKKPIVIIELMVLDAGKVCIHDIIAHVSSSCNGNHLQQKKALDVTNNDMKLVHDSALHNNSVSKLNDAILIAQQILLPRCISELESRAFTSNTNQDKNILYINYTDFSRVIDLLLTDILK